MNSAKVLQNKIALYLRKKIKYQLIAGVINVLVLLVIIWVSTFLADLVFYFSVPVRWFVLIVNSILTVYLIYIMIGQFIVQVWRLKKSADYTPLTKEIGATLPEIDDKLTNIYQLSKEISGNDSAELRLLALDRFIQKITRIDFRSALHMGAYMLPRPFIILVTIGSLLLIAFTTQALSNSALRIINPMGDYELLPEYSFKVSPGDTTILSGNNINITSEYFGPRPEKLILKYKENSSDYFKETELKQKQKKELIEY